MATAISRYGSRVIPTTQQIINDLERRGELIEGPHVVAFEAAFSKRVDDRPGTISTSYGRMAFYYLLKAFAFPAGSEVIVPALTFWVVPEIARVLGLTPVFADVDPATFNLTPAAFERAITAKTVAVVPTHLWGLPCDMDAIRPIALRHGIAIIEDCAHALGATCRGRRGHARGRGLLQLPDDQAAQHLRRRHGRRARPGDRRTSERTGGVGAVARRQGAQRKTLARPGAADRDASHIFTWTLFPAVYG